MVWDESDLDLLPEYCRYQDDGCEFADACLNCPFPDCIYAQPGALGRELAVIFFDEHNAKDAVVAAVYS
jgi:hypothetical protein